MVRDATGVCVLPLVAEELESEIDDYARRWREAAFEEIVADDFLKGCAAGIAKRYLDYHPDPRDCRLVAEAECAKVDLLVTLNGDLINGLAQRAENVRIPDAVQSASTDHDSKRPQIIGG